MTYTFAGAFAIFILYVLFIVMFEYKQPFKYIRFDEAPNLEVIKWETGKDTRVELTKPIPEKYLLKREKYRVNIQINTFWTSSYVYLNVDSDDYSIVGAYISRNDQTPASDRYTYNSYDAPKKINFVGQKESELIFRVIDIEGDVIGEEALHYRILPGGFSYEYDLI